MNQFERCSSRIFQGFVTNVGKKVFPSWGFACLFISSWPAKICLVNSIILMDLGSIFQPSFTLCWSYKITGLRGRLAKTLLLKAAGSKSLTGVSYLGGIIIFSNALGKCLTFTL